MKRVIVFVLVLPVLLLGALGIWAQNWLERPLSWRTAAASEALALEVAPGASAKAVAQAVHEAGVDASPELLYAWFRLSGRSRAIKAGTYELAPGTTPRSLLDKLVRGEQALISVTLIEGWNIRDLLAALQRSPELTQDLDGLSPAEVMARLGRQGQHPEGRFFPDTYRVVKRATASSVLRQAAHTMDERLAQAWAQRAPDVPLKSPEEALILASIVEKETGLASDREQIAGVFANRLRIGMRLQTDPTVIYGLGERFDGNLRRVDLQTDTAYNTYTRNGLPPTPIAMPGWASLMAAVRPAATPALYFVARGDGSSQFSRTLDEHNAAVRRYILGR